MAAGAPPRRRPPTAANNHTQWLDRGGYARVDTAFNCRRKRISLALNITNALDRGDLSDIASITNVRAGNPCQLTLSFTTSFDASSPPRLSKT